MQLFLIRHCQSTNNEVLDQKQSPDELIGGDWIDKMVPDPPLTQKGETQGKLLAQFLHEHKNPNIVKDYLPDHQNVSGFNISHIYCSLMQRSIITAQYISRAIKIPQIVWKDIHECGGLFTQDPKSEKRIGIPGPNHEHFASQYPKLIIPETIDPKGWWNKPIETQKDISNRANKVKTELIKRHGQTNDKVILVTHVGFYHHLLSSILNIPISNKRNMWLHLNNAAISHLTFNKTGIRVNYLNRLDFLPRDLIT